MSNLLANAIPVPGTAKDSNTAKDEEAKTGETVPGGQEPAPWVKVADNLQPAEAVIMKGRLESLKIPAVVQQESIGSVMGLTVGPLGSARLLVPEPLAEQARAILGQTYEPLDRPIGEGE